MPVSTTDNITLIFSLLPTAEKIRVDSGQPTSLARSLLNFDPLYHVGTSDANIKSLILKTSKNRACYNKLIPNSLKSGEIGRYDAG